MLSVHEGQCGLCAHFGEHHSDRQQIVSIRVQHSSPEDYLDECNHPMHEKLHLKVTAISGCDGFEPAPNGQTA